MTAKYYVVSGCRPYGEPVVGRRMSWHRTLEAATRAAERLSINWRSDIAIGIEHAGRIVSRCGTSDMYTGGVRRQLRGWRARMAGERKQ